MKILQDTLSEKLPRFKTSEMNAAIEEFAKSAISESDDIIQSLKRESAVLGTAQFHRLMRILFKAGSHYDGIDYHLPSEFMTSYPNYLQDHTAGITTNEEDEHGYRIIVADLIDLRRDSLEEEASVFYDWHEKNNVKLHSIAVKHMAEILKKHDINPERCASGFGLWHEKFAVLFGKLNRGMVTTQIIEKDKPEFSKIEEIYAEVIGASKIVDKEGAYDIIPEKLVKKWQDYVNPEKRWDMTKGFLYHFLAPYKEKSWVMDVAAGIGVEYRYMLEDGYMMTANEFQEDLRQMGREYFKKAEVDMQYDVYKYDWRKLNTLAFRNKFGALMAVGNSLRVLPSVSGQKESVKSFYELLRNDGILIIDERNYNRFIPKSSDILYSEANPHDEHSFKSLQEFSFKNENPMYHSTDLKAIPFMIDTKNGIIVFRYYPVTSDTHSMDDVNRKKIHEWKFLHKDQMEDLLKDAGFTDIQKYADYDLERKVELYKNYDDASMFVYIARKIKKDDNNG